MGKPKRDKTSRKDEEDLINGDDEVEGSEEAVDLGSVDSQVPAAVAVNKGKKGRRKKDDDWEDDIAGELAGLALEDNDGADDVTNDDPELALPAKQKKKKKTRKAKEVEDVESDDDDEEEEAVTGKPKMKMGFQMLGDLDDNDSPAEGEENDSADSEEEKKASLKKTKQSSVDVEDDEEEEEEEEERVKVDETKKKKSKKSKQDRKKAPTEEDDIDAILAQIESTTKSSKKGKRPLQPDVASHDTAPKVSEEGEDGSDDGHQEAEAEDGDGEHTMKTAAEKKKEKKERQKLQRLQKGKGAAQKPAKSEPAKEQKADADAGGDDKPVATTEAGGQEEEGKEERKGDGEEEEEEEKKKKKDKRKKKKGEKEEEEKVTKKKPSKMVKAMQEQLRKMQEEEERQKREEEERIRLEEEAEREKEEKERVEKERKEKAKLSKKERTDRLKAEGKFMTAKQKEAQRRAKQMLDAMKAQGLEIPQKVEGEKKKRIVYAKKKKVTQSLDREPVSPSDEAPSLDRVSSVEESSEVTEEDQPIVEVEQVAEVTESWEDVKDSWEDEEENKENDTVDSTAVNDSSEKDATNDAETTSDPAPSDQDDDDDADGASSDDDEEESESSEDDSEEDETSARHRAEAKILQRHEEAEKNRSTDVLRAPVVVVLGHVDTGKTKLLDKLRRTNVQDGEAGGITQQIGATNMPHECIREQTKMCKEFAKMDLKLPGMLIIDTPGHESFSNLRSRGSSLCDMAILVVDIMHGLEPQTIESMNLLKARKTPYIVALNKIDRLFQWQACPHSDVLNALKKQKQNTKLEFDERLTSIKVQFAEQGLNATLFSENKDIHEYISLVPTSAHSGDGIGNLIALICIYSQKLLAKRISYSEELQATAMEVKSMPGLGTTVDVILVNGTLHEGDTIVLAGTEGPIVTQIRGLLMPKPMKDFRVKTNFDHHKEVKAAQGVKIIAKDFEKALAGLPVYVSHGPEETEIWKEEIANALKDVLASIRISERGVYVQASTLGSLEALLEFLRTSKIPYSGINIGPVHKKDIMKASVMLEHDGQYATILAFDVKVEREAQEMADGLDVKIFTADIIYHLFDKFMAYREKLKKRKQEEFKFVAVFPCKVRILPQYIFNSRDPIVVGVIVDTGFIKVGTPLCVPSKEFLSIGRVTSLELNHKQVDKATKGQEVCVKIEPTSGETPKMFGRHFDHTDMLVSKINRESIDAVKQYFRDEMTKTDWQLMVELKKTFEII